MATTILWRRLDTPGHDSCRLTSLFGLWRIEGAAVFVSNVGPAMLSYRVDCDRRWRTRSARVLGWTGAQSVDVAVHRAADGRWRLNGEPVAEVEGLCDIDLGFTPATNLNPVRRLALAVGQAADATAAWLDPSDWGLKRLVQRYERTGAGTYAYRAPGLGFAAELHVTDAGFVRDYPGLWLAEAATTEGKAL